MAKVKPQCLKNNHHISGQLLLSDELNEVEFFMTTIYNKYIGDSLIIDYRQPARHCGVETPGTDELFLHAYMNHSTSHI